MKPVLLFTIVMIAAIILAASFGLHIMPIEPIYQLPADVSARALYVCPMASSAFDATAIGLRPFARPINMFFFFYAFVLVFAWGWALYQNLLKDDFKQDAFNTPWMFTKVLFWLIIAVTILMATPNAFRRVTIDGAPGAYVMCEENTPGALPVLSEKVKP